MTNTLDTQIRNLVTELMDAVPQAPSLSELERRETREVAQVQPFPLTTHRFSLRRPVVLAILGAAVAVGAGMAGLVATGSSDGRGRNGAASAGSRSQLTSFDRQQVISAVQTANQHQILSQTTKFVSAGGQVVNADRVVVDTTSGDAANEMLSSSGGPSDALVFDDGSVIHIDYSERVWWTVTTAGAGSPTLLDPEATAAGVQSLVSSGQLKVASSTDVHGEAATELVGQGVLPGSTLTLWVSQATNLPIQAIGTQSDGSKQITTYQWLERNDLNLSLVTPTVPPGFTHLSGPPAGEVPASPLG
jgi:hypothetical protein